MNKLRKRLKRKLIKYRFTKFKAQKPGQAPGTLVLRGQRKMEESRVKLADFNEHTLEEKDITDLSTFNHLHETPTTTWLHVQGLQDIGLIQRIGEGFGIHPLILEDILHTGQRPKMEEGEGYLYIVIKLLSYKEEAMEVSSEQISIIFTPHTVISIQEGPEDPFIPVRERLEVGKPRIRKGGTDYLAYALMDLIVDHYYVVLEQLGEDIEELEVEAFQNPTKQTLEKINLQRRNLINLRRMIWPVREVLNSLIRLENPLLKKATNIYFRDVYDHTVQIVDMLENYRDLVGNNMDIYLSTISHRMNEVMKVLTIIATIFIPLTFVAGIYGMNFEYMPELTWHNGYFYSLGLMAVITIIMLIFFRYKRWF